MGCHLSCLDKIFSLLKVPRIPLLLVHDPPLYLTVLLLAGACGEKHIHIISSQSKTSGFLWPQASHTYCLSPVVFLVGWGCTPLVKLFWASPMYAYLFTCYKYTLFSEYIMFIFSMYTQKVNLRSSKVTIKRISKVFFLALPGIWAADFAGYCMVGGNPRAWRQWRWWGWWRGHGVWLQPERWQSDLLSPGFMSWLHPDSFCIILEDPNSHSAWQCHASHTTERSWENMTVLILSAGST